MALLASFIIRNFPHKSTWPVFLALSRRRLSLKPSPFQPPYSSIKERSSPGAPPPAQCLWRPPPRPRPSRPAAAVQSPPWPRRHSSPHSQPAARPDAAPPGRPAARTGPCTRALSKLHRPPTRRAGRGRGPCAPGGAGSEIARIWDRPDRPGRGLLGSRGPGRHAGGVEELFAVGGAGLTVAAWGGCRWGSGRRARAARGAGGRRLFILLHLKYSKYNYKSVQPLSGCIRCNLGPFSLVLCSSLAAAVV